MVQLFNVAFEIVLGDLKHNTVQFNALLFVFFQKLKKALAVVKHQYIRILIDKNQQIAISFFKPLQRLPDDSVIDLKLIFFRNAGI